MELFLGESRQLFGIKLVTLNSYHNEKVIVLPNLDRHSLGVCLTRVFCQHQCLIMLPALNIRKLPLKEHTHFIAMKIYQWALDHEYRTTRLTMLWNSHVWPDKTENYLKIHLWG